MNVYVMEDYSPDSIPMFSISVFENKNNALKAFREEMKNFGKLFDNNDIDRFVTIFSKGEVVNLSGIEYRLSKKTLQ